MKLYMIRNWSTRFENNRTRELKKLDWVPTPNRHDGDGYITVMSHQNGEALFGAWNAILQIASRCSGTIPQEGAVGVAGGCGGRGVLLRESGKPHDAASLAARTRFKVTTMQEALDLCSSVDVGWLECVEYTNKSLNPAPPCDNPAPACDNPAPKPQEGITEGKGMEGKGIEGKKRTKTFQKPSIEEVVAFCLSHKLLKSDGEAFFWCKEGNGWKNGDNPVKDWKATIRQWKVSGYHPSQKNGGLNFNPVQSELTPQQQAEKDFRDSIS